MGRPRHQGAAALWGTDDHGDPLGRGAPAGIPAEELARRRVDDERGTGQALVGRLVKGCLDRGIEPRTGMRATRLLTEGTRVVGVRFESPDGPVDVRARRGVVIATGGFEWDADLVRAFLRGPLARPASPPHGNTGDGLRMAMRVGACLGNMREAWWAPTIDVPMPDGSTAVWLINGERTRPRCIMVNGRGQRFTNEAVNYNAFGAAFHVIDTTTFEYVNHPAWMIFDDVYWRRYGLAGARADQPVPSWITAADSLSQLAKEIDVPAGELEKTVRRWNENTAHDQDPDFGRGTSAIDKWWGDPQFGDGPAATLGPLDTPPFYAVRVYSGCLGTKGGPKTDDQARVLDLDGAPIEGLYAAGNAMAASAHGNGLRRRRRYARPGDRLGIPGRPVRRVAFGDRGLAGNHRRRPRAAVTQQSSLGGAIRPAPPRARERDGSRTAARRCPGLAGVQAVKHLRRPLALPLRAGAVEHGLAPGRDPVGGRPPDVPGEPGVLQVHPPRVADRDAAGRVPVLAHHRDHAAVGLGDRGREPHRGWQQFLVRDHVVRDADPQRGRRVDEVAGQRDLAGPGHADPAGQVDQHGTGVDADPQVGVGERGAVGRDDEVGHQGELEPAGHGRPVHRRDHRHPRSGDGRR